MPDGLRDRLQTSLGAAYTIERELGGGGMSRVFVAEETRFRRRVVIKVLSPELAAGLSVERFEREITLAAQLQHANVVPVITAGEVDGLPYYSMPFVDGESLRARLERGRVPCEEAVSILRDVARALAYAHAHGVVHRDIKPENVLLSGGAAVVTDFGIAKALSAAKTQAPGGTLTQIGTSLGTPAYMAPEQAAGDHVDHRADLYAWGVVAYELLSGKHPFAGRTTAAQLMAAHLAETPRPLLEAAHEVPPALAALVMRTLEKEPSARPPSAGAVVDALSGIAITGERAPTGRALKTRARPILVGLVALVAVTAGAALAVRSRQQPRSAASIAAPRTITTLAVLPFVNTGGDPRDEYFSDGMTDELANALARLPGLRIAGRTSSFSFKGKNAPPEEVGRALNVAGVIEGTVRRAGDRLRITAELTGTTDGVVLWRKSYERAAGEEFQVQDDVTREFVTAIAPTLGGQAAVNVAATNRGTSDPEAYDLYLRGRYFWVKRGGANLTRAIEYFQQAIAKDSTFARAHAGLAGAYVVMRSYVDVPPDSMSNLATVSARRALALDSTLADAHSALGYALMSRVRLLEAERSFLQAVELDPSNPNTRHWHAINLNGLGLVDSAYAETSRAAAIDPMSAVFVNHQALTLLFMGRLREAIAHWQKAIELDSTFSLPYRNLATAYILAGVPDSALQWLDRQRQAASAPPRTRSLYLRTHAVLGQWAEVDRVAAEIQARGMSATEEMSLALVNGDHQAAIVALQRGLTPKGGLIFDIVSPGCDPTLQPLHAEPRYQALMSRLGLGVCPVRTPWPFKARPSGAGR